MRTHKYNYTELLPEERPNYKAVNFGFQGLTTTELVSLIIGQGGSSTNLMRQARQLLNTAEGKVKDLARKRLEDMKVVQGIGDCKAIALQAAIELGRRYMREQAEETPQLTSASRIYNYMRPRIGDLPEEEFWAVYQAKNYSVIKAKRIGKGGLTEVSADLRVILREALLCNATVLTVCHNHPSGSTTPSRDDDNLTGSLKKACQAMRLYLSDHVIITAGNYFSYKENGRL